MFLLMNTGETGLFQERIGYDDDRLGIDGKVNYALEGSIFVAERSSGLGMNCV